MSSFSFYQISYPVSSDCNRFFELMPDFALPFLFLLYTYLPENVHPAPNEDYFRFSSVLSLYETFLPVLYSGSICNISFRYFFSCWFPWYFLLSQLILNFSSSSALLNILHRMKPDIFVFLFVHDFSLSSDKCPPVPVLLFLHRKSNLWFLHKKLPDLLLPQDNNVPFVRLSVLQSLFGIQLHQLLWHNL